MQAPLRPTLAAALLLALAPLAGAETPMTDPIAPAVVGRPLDETWTVRPARKKPPAQVAQKAKRPKQEVAAAPAKPVPARPAVAVAAAPAPAPNTAAMGNVRALAPVPLGPPAFSSRDQALVRKYYEATPVAGQAPNWRIGQRVPEGAAMTGVPREVRTALTALPPGHQYIQLDGEVVLVAVQSRIVVDGVSRRY